jgi:hypothetical protein
MTSFIQAIVFLAGMPVCLFLLPTSWWPWSLGLWFAGIVAASALLHATARRWLGQPVPPGLAGIGVSLVLAFDQGESFAFTDSDTGGGDSGGGDGGGGD